MKRLKIRTEEIKEHGRRDWVIESHTCTAIEDIARTQHLAITCSLAFSGNVLVLEGKIKGSLFLECCRCLDQYTYPVEITLHQTYPAELEEIDIEDEINQLLILSLPTKPLCKTDCPGICPECGKNLNKEKCRCEKQPHEPRWEKLKNLLK